jgi:hypothetical protein
VVRHRSAPDILGPGFSRYTPPGQQDWTDMGLLRLAAKLDESELAWADDED